MMTVLVGYASAYGSTKGIASRVGEHLRAAGFEVDVHPVDEIDSVNAYEAVIIGSAIHNQKWLPSGDEFMRAHAEALASPVWLFSVCSIGETTSFLSERLARIARRRRKVPPTVSEVQRPIDLRDHRYFAGAIERTHWSAAGNLFLRLCGGTYGDHRDWMDIERWTAGIATALGARGTPANQG
ncbi:MAG: flavodoxin domain-containing protein [Candidatus Microthrix subdominans]|nr:flavodoxin domain-containing protein [uncultured Candidatus Microthrix sp.]MBK6310181.1 flavodoxin domain-containing protein [Candidatus Microthrix sp.]MBP9065291.1 flavodoxin domain-containing protein [Candidatus Microthrix sp.]HMS48953.1 flavodoxin domain-containing protein [Candidatus Microthrix sp.]